MLGQFVALGGEAFNCLAGDDRSQRVAQRPAVERPVLPVEHIERRVGGAGVCVPDLTRDGVLEAVAAAVGYWLTDRLRGWPLRASSWGRGGWWRVESPMKATPRSAGAAASRGRYTEDWARIWQSVPPTLTRVSVSS